MKRRGGNTYLPEVSGKLDLLRLGWLEEFRLCLRTWLISFSEGERGRKKLNEWVKG